MYETRMLSEHTSTHVNECNTQQSPPGITCVAHIRTSTRFNKQEIKQETRTKNIVTRHNERSNHTNMVHVQQTLLHVQQTKQHTKHNSHYTYKKCTEACTTTIRLTPQRTAPKKRTKQKLQAREKAIVYMLLTSRNNASSSD